ncbi:MAG: right-handed parallel beta-helix repeat-containing protein [archaeon]
MTVNVSKILSSFFNALLIATLVCGLIQTTSMIVIAQSGLVVVIDSDTTWTKADSPYNITGPMLVNNGVTLSIEAGTIVNLNKYDLKVNGTLRAIGTATENINFINGNKIEFSQYSNPWNEQICSGSIIQYSILNSCQIHASVPVKLDNNILMDVVVSDSSIVTNNEISGNVTAASSNIISDNNIKGWVSIGVSTVISNSTIEEDIIAKDAGVTNCYIAGSISAEGCNISNNEIRQGITGTSLMITNNVVTVLDYLNPYNDGAAIFLEGGTSTISGNTITGGGYYYDLKLQPTVPIGAIDLRSSSVTILDNIINGSGIRISRDCGTLIITNNTINAGIFCSYTTWDNERREYSVNTCEISGNAIIGNIEVNANTLSVSNNNIIGERGTGIDFSVRGQQLVTLKDNKISGYSTGILGDGNEILIENNLIENNIRGIKCNGATVIQNNTIANNDIGIYVKSSLTTIRYNNIENNNSSIRLDETPNNIDSTNNWWGTTNIETINLTIYDYKYDFNLGKVNFTPILTDPNPNAEPEYALPIPEFSSWTILPLMLGIILGIVLVKKKIQ